MVYYWELVRLAGKGNVYAQTYLVANSLLTSRLEHSPLNASVVTKYMNIDVFIRLIPIIYPYKYNLNDAYIDNSEVIRVMDGKIIQINKDFLDLVSNGDWAEHEQFRDILDYIVDKNNQYLTIGATEFALPNIPKTTRHYIPLKPYSDANITKFLTMFDVNRWYIDLVLNTGFLPDHRHTFNSSVMEHIILTIYLFRYVTDRLSDDDHPWRDKLQYNVFRNTTLQLYMLTCHLLVARVSISVKHPGEIIETIPMLHRLLDERPGCAPQPIRLVHPHIAPFHAMARIVAIAPPIVTMAIPGLNEFLESNNNTPLLRHILTFCATEPVFTRDGFDVSAIMQPASYFNEKYGASNIANTLRDVNYNFSELGLPQ